MTFIIITALAMVSFGAATVAGVRLWLRMPQRNPILAYGIVVAFLNFLFRVATLTYRVLGISLGEFGIAAALGLQFALGLYLFISLGYAMRAYFPKGGDDDGV